MTMGQIISMKRRDLGLTQDGLAEVMAVTNQSVSKWESDKCYPDIATLPKLADLFGITIDALFGRTPVPEKQIGKNLPWDDDNTLRAVLYLGHTLLEHRGPADDSTFIFNGNPENVESAFNLQCGDVVGKVSAGGSVNCDSVGGDVKAGHNVNCDGVSGNVAAGGDVRCDSVAGNVIAGGRVSCDNIGGDVKAGSLS